MAMQHQDLVLSLGRLAEDRAVVNSLNLAMRTSIVVAGFTILGGMLLGPAGLAVGGTVSSLCLAAATKLPKKPLLVLLLALPLWKRRELFEFIKARMTNLKIEDVGSLLYLVATATLGTKVQLLRIVIEFLGQQQAIQ